MTKELANYNLMLEYKNYIRCKKQSANLKSAFIFKDTRLLFTHKQIEVLKLVAKGFSNSKIARELSLKESTVKLNVYRIMRYIERVLLEKVDRFYLIIIAQKLDLENNRDIPEIEFEELQSLINNR